MHMICNMHTEATYWAYIYRINCDCDFVSRSLFEMRDRIFDHWIYFSSISGQFTTSKSPHLQCMSSSRVILFRSKNNVFLIEFYSMRVSLPVVPPCEIHLSITFAATHTSHFYSLLSMLHDNVHRTNNEHRTHSQRASCIPDLLINLPCIRWREKNRKIIGYLQLEKNKQYKTVIRVIDSDTYSDEFPFAILPL